MPFTRIRQRPEACHWAAPLPDDLPVGVELLLPQLIDEAAAAGLDLPNEAYIHLRELGARRRRMIARLQLRPGTTPVHSWEAIGTCPDPALLDAAGSIGNSPAATAAWLRAVWLTVPGIASTMSSGRLMGSMWPAPARPESWPRARRRRGPGPSAGA